LLSNFLYTNPFFVRELFRRTGVKLKIEPEVIQKKYLEIITSNLISTGHLEDCLSAMKELSGISPELGSIENQVQETYRTIILNARSYEQDGYRYNYTPA